MSESKQPGQATRIGNVLVYKLRPDQYPDDPEELWCGKIEMVLVDINDSSQRHYYLITSIKAGYDGERELVYPDQIVNIQ